VPSGTSTCSNKKPRMLEDRSPQGLTDRLAPKVAGLRDGLQGMPPATIAARSRAVLEGDKLVVTMLFEAFEVDTETYAVSRPDGPDADSFVQALVLTYLHTADGTRPAGRWISFRELPDGGFYHQAFQGYAADRLVKHWGLDADGFGDACRALGGSVLDLGDAGYALSVLPRIDLGVVYWRGDDELPSRASVLFDANVSHYMVTDGLAILGSRLIDRILQS